MVFFVAVVVCLLVWLGSVWFDLVGWLYFCLFNICFFILCFFVFGLFLFVCLCFCSFLV